MVQDNAVFPRGWRWGESCSDYLQHPESLGSQMEVTELSDTGNLRFSFICEIVVCLLPDWASLGVCEFCPTPHLKLQGLLLLPSTFSALAPGQQRVVQPQGSFVRVVACKLAVEELLVRHAEVSVEGGVQDGVQG